MKFFLPLLLSTLSLSAQLNISKSPYVIAFFGTNAPAAADNLVREEKFSNGSGYDLTWSRDTGAWFNPDATWWYAYSPHSLLGSNAGSFKYITNSIPKVDTNWFAIKVITVTSSSASIGFGLSVFDTIDVLTVKPGTGNKWRYTHGGIDAGDVASMPWVSFETNRLWIQNIRGTAGDGYGKIWFSNTSDTWSDSYLKITSTGGPTTGQADVFTIQTGNGDVFYCGVVRVWQQYSRPNWDF